MFGLCSVAFVVLLSYLVAGTSNAIADRQWIPIYVRFYLWFSSEIYNLSGPLGLRFGLGGLNSIVVLLEYAACAKSVGNHPEGPRGPGQV